MKHISVNLLPNIGIEINGINCSSLNVADSKFLLDKYNNHHLLVIKNQKLEENELILFAQLFGEPVASLLPTYRLKNYPVITKHSNERDKNQVLLGAMAPEYVYHSDSYFTVNPNKATLLYSLISPNDGGATYFTDMCFAYKTLDKSIKNLILDKKAIYKNAYINQPPVKHPLVRVHPVTKQKALFVNIHRALGIENIEDSEALILLKKLYEHATRSQFTYQHQWSNGDLLVWNNVATMHCATEIKNNEKRLLYRILTKGDLPVI